MKNIVKTELYKMKRYYIPLVGVALMLLSVLITIFTSLANDGCVWDFTFLTEQVIKNNMTTFFPVSITLIVGYIINREQKDDTLKNILTIPISFKKLLVGKLIVGGILSIILGIICFLFTIVTNQIVKFPGLTYQLAIQSFLQITFVNLFLYIAVLPIIVATSHRPNSYMAGVIFAFVYGYIGLFAAGSETLINIYPITASLGMIHYRSYQVNWNLPLCSLSMISMIAVSVILIKSIGNKIKFKKSSKKEINKTHKKGW